MENRLESLPNEEFANMEDKKGTIGNVSAAKNGYIGLRRVKAFKLDLPWATRIVA